MTPKPVNYTTRKPLNLTQVRAGLAERLQNCVSFSDRWSGAEREGWLEDADFYASIIALLDSNCAELAATQQALEPLSGPAEIFGQDWHDEDELEIFAFSPDEDFVETGKSLFILKVGDFRKARALKDKSHE